MTIDAARAAGQRTADRAGKAHLAAADAIAADLARVQVAAGMAAAKAAAVDRNLGAIAERAADANDVRLAMGSEIAAAATALAKRLHVLLIDAVADGWEAGAAEQDSLISGVRIAAERPPESALAGVPVFGHSLREIALHQASVWQFAAEGVIGQAGAMGDPGVIPPGLAQASDAAAKRAGQAIGDAFATGASLARRAVAGALSRAG